MESKIQRGPEMPIIGDTVHYVAYGTPGGEYAQACRAATVTQLGGWIDVHESLFPIATPDEPDDHGMYRTLRQRWDPTALGVCVLNPGGMFFNTIIPFGEGDIIDGKRTDMCSGAQWPGGSWHHRVRP
jgi:hypothetical protein